ncbi:hypothetical protein [Mesonia aestuariivivens]|uniref:PAP2 family protein n=1 Tax=Mesonia aestuariivivens TaxID=2796128 RepID=A0ABS6W223_9FLAO|nr:hypothetical protein [Mesonia aestuariivivens]MBW2961869.1 hypothetical protein [Mesonia aestuariivivens]
MKWFIRLASYIFHPLWMPILGSIAYFVISPRFLPNSIIKAKLLAIAILTIFIPIVFYFLLKNLGLVKNIRLPKAKERCLPMVFFCLILLTVLNFVLAAEEFAVLHYFFTGILYSSFIAFLMNIFKYKVSLHMMGIAGVTCFITYISIIYSTNLICLIAFLFFSIGWTASSRIQQKAHHLNELIIGLIVGILPQVSFLMIEHFFL